jgi:hypothetical protein
VGVSPSDLLCVNAFDIDGYVFHSSFVLEDAFEFSDVGDLFVGFFGAREVEIDGAVL